MDQLLQIRNLKNRFNITETRVTNCGANVYLGVFPKDGLERTDFVEFDSPKNSAVSDLSKGYLLTVDKPNFTRWHSDYMEAIDCLITLYGSGEKHWFFFPPSKMCGVLERCYTRKMTLLVVYKNMAIRYSIVDSVLGIHFICPTDGFIVL